MNNKSFFMKKLIRIFAQIVNPLHFNKIILNFIKILIRIESQYVNHRSYFSKIYNSNLSRPS